MNHIVRNQRITLIILLAATVAATLYIISLKLAYPVFQNTWLFDPMAELASLFPLYYIAITITALLGAACYIFRIDNRNVHVLLLIMLAVMLFYTRYYLAGFTWEPDGPRNLAIALHIPEILHGAVFTDTGYGSAYPFPSILEYALFHITGTTYTAYLHLMPLFNIVIFTLLCYAFTSRLFRPLIAFATTLLAMLGMHYNIFIMGAHTYGVLLLLTSLVLVFRRDKASWILAFCAIVAMILGHPISPILLGIFLGAAFLAFLSRYRIKPQVVIILMLVVCMAGWYVWRYTPVTLVRDETGETPPARTAVWELPGEEPTEQTPEPSPAGETPGEERADQTPQPSPAAETPGEEPVDQTTEPSSDEKSPEEERLEQLWKRIFPKDLGTAGQYLTGKIFIFDTVSNINRAIYAFYGLLAAVLVLFTFIRARARYRNIRVFLSNLGGLTREELFLILSTVLLLVLSVLLAQEMHVLIERGLTFAILALSGVIVSIADKLYTALTAAAKKILAGATAVIIVCLTLAFPLVAYSIDAYTSFPVSEAAGIEFLAETAPLETQDLVTTSPGQIILYQPLVASSNGLISYLSLPEGDIYFFRKTGYYYAAMRYDFSFEENRITRFKDAVSTSTAFNHIYFNPTSGIYVKR